MSSHPKKHHFVPQFLLHRFSGPGGQLIVHQYMHGRQFTSSVINVGHRKYGHSLYWPGREPDHSSMESAMAAIEGEAATAVKRLAVGRHRAVPDEVRRPLAWLIALQYQRSRFLMHILASKVRAKDVGLSDEEIQTGLMTHLNAAVLHPWRLRGDHDAEFKDRWNALVALLLMGTHWSCYRPQQGGLLVGDNLVCLSGSTGSTSQDIPRAFLDHGIGVGLENFRRVTVPLGDDLALIVSRVAQDASRLDVASLNRFTVFNSREFIAHSPTWAEEHPALASDLQSSLQRQRLVAPAFLENYSG
ncbi:DUF4238 domain-containing protein [Streptomyces sp. NPDC060035]|uniref:DUF4238 domain-containing protein n=1 Tax=Streptomyces sp. NPDC060035 TaxID=3347044 RepID=UPI0036A8FE81